MINDLKKKKKKEKNGSLHKEINELLSILYNPLKSLRRIAFTMSGKFMIMIRTRIAK